jgi:hypothetical protein
LGALLTFAAYRFAVAHRSPGDWLPGIGQLVFGTLITSVPTFGCGLAAFLRRERGRWWALLPLLGGLTVILYFASNLLQH